MPDVGDTDDFDTGQTSAEEGEINYTPDAGDSRLEELIGEDEHLELLEVFLERGKWPVQESTLHNLTTCPPDRISNRLEELRNKGLVEETGDEYQLAGSTLASRLAEARNRLHTPEFIESVKQEGRDEGPHIVGSPFVELFRQDEDAALLGWLLDTDGELSRGGERESDSKTTPERLGMVKRNIEAGDSDDGREVDYELRSNHPVVNSLQKAVKEFGDPPIGSGGVYFDVEEGSVFRRIQLGSPPIDSNNKSVDVSGSDE